MKPIVLSTAMCVLCALAAPAGAQPLHEQLKPVRGTVVTLKCPPGQVGVSLYWSDDPTQAGVRYIRDPGNISRCFAYDTPVAPAAGTRVEMLLRKADLHVVGPTHAQDAPLSAR